MNENSARSLEQKFVLRVIPPLLLLSMATGLVLSIMSMFDICTEACSDTHSYVIFGMDLGWFGIAFFSCGLILCALRRRCGIAASIFSLLVFAAAGAELNFIRIQKYGLENWCPICLSIATVVFLTVLLLLYEQAKHTGFSNSGTKRNAAIGIAAFLLGLSCTFFGMKQDTSLPPLPLPVKSQASP